mmetsp:Transcript_45869/g.85257  ORF Transcript_45869/g.85257 Transcript_45869/m.85257 type:complete len:538 (+) Transcript_45869:538-2151(+)
MDLVVAVVPALVLPVLVVPALGRPRGVVPVAVVSRVLRLGRCRAGGAVVRVRMGALKVGQAARRGGPVLSASSGAPAVPLVVRSARGCVRSRRRGRRLATSSCRGVGGVEALGDGGGGGGGRRLVAAGAAVAARRRGVGGRLPDGGVAVVPAVVPVVVSAAAAAARIILAVLARGRVGPLVLVVLALPALRPADRRVVRPPVGRVRPRRRGRRRLALLGAPLPLERLGVGDGGRIVRRRRRAAGSPGRRSRRRRRLRVSTVLRRGDEVAVGILGLVVRAPPPGGGGRAHVRLRVALPGGRVREVPSRRVPVRRIAVGRVGPRAAVAVRVRRADLGRGGPVRVRRADAGGVGGGRAAVLPRRGRLRLGAGTVLEGRRATRHGHRRQRRSGPGRVVHLFQLGLGRLRGVLRLVQDHLHGAVGVGVRRLLLRPVGVPPSSAFLAPADLPRVAGAGLVRLRRGCGLAAGGRQLAAGGSDHRLLGLPPLRLPRLPPLHGSHDQGGGDGAVADAARGRVSAFSLVVGNLDGPPLGGGGAGLVL